MSYFSSSRDTSPIPLLNEHRHSVSLQTLSPRRAPSSRATASPPPSFYRDLNDNHNHNHHHIHTPSNSGSTFDGSPSRTKGRTGRRIQFAAPPPPIVSSVFLSPQTKGMRHVVESSSTHGQGKGNGNGSSAGGSASGRSRSARDGRNRSVDSNSNANSVRRGGIASMDPLLVLERKQRAIQAEIQELLDAQSAGLIKGFGGEGNDGGSDAGSSTPTSRSLQRERGVGVVPVRQPKKKVLGLRGARKALLRDMGELVLVKMEENAVLEEEVRRREEVLAMVAEWEKRIEAVREQLSSYTDTSPQEAEDERGNEEAREIAELRVEEKAVDTEIREMEDRLASMRARKGWLGERIKECVNRREARLSSYRGALREVEGEVKDFLKRPPLAASVVMDGEESFTSLPGNRRTLGLAREWWDKEVSVLAKRKRAVEEERGALEEGAEMWSECINVIVGFEDDLRREMSASLGDKEMLRKQVKRMGSVIAELQGKADEATQKGWKLIMCAVGAELEAFKEGEGILKGALGGISPGMEREDSSDDKLDGGGLNGAASREQMGALIDDGDVSTNGHEHAHRHGSEPEHGHRQQHEEDNRDDDGDSVLNELNAGIGMDGSQAVRARALHSRIGDRERTSFGSGDGDEDGEPDLASLMVDVGHGR